MKTRASRQAFRLAVIYVIAGGAWVAVSEVILKRFASNLEECLGMGALQALIFVVVTGGLLYLIWRHLLRQWEQEMAQREASEKNLHRTERALKTVSACNGVLVRATSEATLLAEICRVIVDTGGYRMTWVGFVEHNEQKSVHIPVHAGADDGFLKSFTVYWDENNPRGRGPTGIAIRTGRFAVSHDFENDPNIAPWRADAIRHGFACSISLPLREGQATFGVLTLYAAERNAFNSQEVELLNELADNLAYGIQALRTRVKQLEAEKAQQLFRALIDRSSDGIHVADPVTGRFLDVNESACQSLGHTRNELLAMSAFDVVVGMDAALFGAINLRLREVGQTTLEIGHRRKDGTTFPAEVSLSLIMLDRGYLLAIVRDVTQRRLAEETVRESERRYRQLFEMESDAVILVDCETHRYVDVNRSALKMYGYSREEFLQLKPEDVSAEPELTAATVGSGHVFVPIRWHRKKNGEQFAVEITANQMDHQGRRIELATLRDVTVRQRVMATLQETTGRLMEAQRLAGLGSYVYDLGTGGWTSSEILDELLGVVGAGDTRDAASWLQIIHPEDRVEMEHYLREVVFKRPVPFDCIYRIIRQNDQQTRWVHGLGRLVLDEQGRAAQMVGTLQDITHAKRVEESLRQSEAFVRNVLDSLTAHIAVLDEHGTIVAVNRAWRRFAEENGGDVSRTLLGANYLAVCQPVNDAPAEPSAAAASAGLRAVMTGAQSSFHLEYPCHAPATQRWFSMHVWPLGEAGGGVVVAHENITERKIAEAQLHLQATVLGAAANAIAITDPQGIIEWVNPAFSKHTGFSAAEAVGSNPRVLKSGHHPPEFYADMWATITSGAVWHGELINQRKDGRIVIEDTTITPVRDGNGQIAHFVAIKQDITNHKQTERLLEFVAQEGWSGPQEGFLARLAQFLGRTLSVDYVFIGQLKDGQTVQTSGLYARGKIVPDIEYSRRGTPCHQVIGNVLCHYGERLQEMFPEDRLLVEMGAQSYLGIPLMDSAGRSLGLIAILDGKPMPDVQLATALLQVAAVRVAGEMERQAKVDELHWKTALLEAQMEAAPDGILMIDNRGRRILQNQRMNDLLKIPPHVSEDKDDQVQVEFVASRAKDPDQMKDKVAYLYAHPEEISRDELEFVDGTIVDRYSSPVRDKAGNSCGRIWTFRDITQSRQMEAQLRQSQKMEAIGQLAGGVAHDFNNILAALFMQTDLLEMVEQLPEEVRDGLKQLRQDAQRAAGLTRQLLLFSRRQVMQSSVLDLNEVVNNVAKMLQRIIGEDVRLELDLHAVPLLTHADAGMVEQVLMNLAVNARDAMPEGGRLRIETTEKIVTGEPADLCPDALPGRYVCFSVSDTGGGIPPEIMPRIFEPFFTTKEAGKGTGLGLATVFGIIKQHRGWIHVDNQPGRGVTFRIFLPAGSVAETKATQTSDKPSPRGGPETILLVEDEPRVRKSISTILKRNGYHVVAAANGSEALELWGVHHHEMALLLTDLVMPGGMKGHELARRLQSAESNLKVVYMSGYSAEIAGRDIELRSGENFLQKPFLSDHLLETIRRSLDGLENAPP
jgi:PAS domain S-box-containing protein